MSLQDATEGSGSPKSRSKALSAISSLCTYDGTGSLKDRLLTAFWMVTGALCLSLLALAAPYGRLVCVAFTAVLVAMSIFEVVRLFARDHDTLHYRPVAGAVMYLILAVPAITATLSAIQSVLFGLIWWQAVHCSTLVAVSALIVVMACEGRDRLDGATRLAERYGVAFFVVGVCAPALITLSALPRGIQLLWWLAGCAAINDVAAYFVGRSFGAHKMAPALSPNKSIEGSIAGIFAGSVAGVLLWGTLVGQVASAWQVTLVSLMVVLAAQSGDLAKSYLKRLRGVKDMGALFPGHGGVLDRFDAMIAAAPVLLVSLCLLGAV